MNNKTFETVQQTIHRFEAILEVDKSLKPWEVNNIEVMLELLKALRDENSVTSNPA